MPEAYQFVSYDKDGKSLPPDELFNAWVQMAEQLAKSLPVGENRNLCAAVYAAVTADREEMR